MSRILAALLAGACLTAPAFAEEEPPCPMTYADYEFAVPHLDVDTCPEAIAGEDRFCRAAAGNDYLHVSAFSEEGEQCLIGMVSLSEEDFTLTLD